MRRVVGLKPPYWVDEEDRVPKGRGTSEERDAPRCYSGASIFKTFRLKAIVEIRLGNSACHETKCLELGWGSFFSSIKR